MTCDRYFELLSARLDRELTREEAEEVELHRAGCSACRMAGAQLDELREAFADFEDLPAPEGFAQGVMDRIRAEKRSKKVIPLFRRPQFKVLAGLAACLVLAAGLYGAGRYGDGEKREIMPRDFSRSAAADETDGAAYGSVSLEETDLSMASACKAPEAALYDGIKGDVEPMDDPPVQRMSDSAILVMDRMPVGAEDFLPDEPGAVTVARDLLTGEEGYQWWTEDGPLEALAQIERLAQEQDITCARSSAPAEDMQYSLVILQPDH